ncbi:MAG: LamG-like jellyroll fold domain-containing protein [Pyrinomonadaceae bacterium]
MYRKNFSFLLTAIFFGAVFFQAAQTFGQTDAPAPFSPCTPAPIGLVSWYPAENNALDIRSRNNGTLGGIQGHFPTYTAGVVGQAFQFDGLSFVTIPDSPSLHITTTLTLEGWVKPASGIANGSLDTIVFKGNQSSLAGQPYSLFLNVVAPNTYKLDFRLGNETTATALDSVSSLAPDTYTHVAATYDGATMRIYINGFLDASVNTNIGTLNNTDTNPLEIGDGVGNFTGAVDEFSIYNRTLSASEILAIDISGINGKCKPTATVSPSGQVAWFAGDGDAKDLSGNGNNGALGSQTAFAVGKVGQALKFNGNTASAVIVPDSPSLRPANVSIDAWVNPAVYSFLSIIAIKGNTSQVAQIQPYLLALNGNQIAFQIGNGTNSDLLTSTSLVPLNVYTHVAATYDGTTMQIYINGVLDASKTSTLGSLIQTDTNPLAIGGEILSPPQTVIFQFNGAIDELSIYNRALTPAEITSIYNAGLAGKLKQTTTATNTATIGSATVTFPTAAQRTVQQIPLDPALFPALPMGTNTGLDFDIAADVPDSSPMVCFNLPSFTTAQFPSLRIYHFESGAWVNRTASSNTYPNLCTTGLTSLSPFAIGLNAPTAAPVSIGGRVLIAGGRGIRNVRVSLTDASGETRIAITNAFGYYHFADVESGATYILSVSAKRYRFENPTQVISVNEEIENADFVAAP